MKSMTKSTNWVNSQRKLRDQLMTLWRGSLTRRTSTEPVRDAAEECGKLVALDFQTHWQASRNSHEGPIDVIDMFSGCGGMSAGFRAVNSLFPAFRQLLGVDLDPVANSSYELNFGRTPFYEDVSAFARSPRRLSEVVRIAGGRRNGPLVLIGCAPCQGFSSHRNQAGEEDLRNSLFKDFATVASLLQPDAVVIENVPELLTERYWPYVTSIRRILERNNYKVHVSVHNMAEFGVPQERFRALVLAFKRKFRPARGFLNRSEFRTVRQAIGKLPEIKAGERDPNDPLHYTAAHHASTLRTIRAVPPDGGNRPPHIGPQCLQRIANKQGKAGYEDVYGRLYWDRPAITITAYARNPASGRFVHPKQDRGLSIREAASLQGFPSGYTFAGSLDQAFRQIGNAVPPPFSAYLASLILGELLAPSEFQGQVEPGVTKPIARSFSRLIPSLKSRAHVAENA
jgi:DNA (cytosine-5)-methyltransferase 1